MLLKVEVPVWFSSQSPWQHCQQEKVEREKEREKGKRWFREREIVGQGFKDGERE